MALINENSSAFETLENLNTGSNLCNQVTNYYSQTLLLNNRIDFRSEKDFDEEDSDDDFPTSIEKLKNKYNVLSAASVSDRNQNNCPDKSQQKMMLNYSSLNGYHSSMKTKQSPQKSVNNNNNVDSNELGEPKRILYPRENIRLEWEKPLRIGAGLVNLGNTCFMNSVLQSLTYCPPLYNFLNSLRENGHQSTCRLSSSFCMLCLMLNHVTTVLNQDRAIKPLKIYQRLKSIAIHFTHGRQEDAHEFLRYVIDHMSRACLAYHELESDIPGLVARADHLTKQTTAINHIFGGYHRSQVSCLNCKAQSSTYDYFMDFMLDIQNVSSLEEALGNFVNSEILKHENAYKCTKCKKSVAARKQFTVYRAPNVATFQFKRFDSVRMFGKIIKAVSYPEKLNLRPFMSESGPPLFYKLISVLVHYGNTCNSGHYYCYVRSSNNSWFKMDDSQVFQVGLDEVLSQRAYILFYIRYPNETVEKKILSQKMNVPTKPKISSTNDNSQANLTPNNCNNNNKIFNPNFKFVLKSIPSVSVTNTNVQKNKSLDENNNLKTNKTETNECLKLKIHSVVNHPSLSANGKQSITSNGLVPYDQEDNSDDNDAEKIPKASQHRSNQEKWKPSPTKNIETTPIKEKTIPILKVKATTNSWQVVEASSGFDDDDYSTKNKSRIQEWNSNWKISKSSDCENSSKSQSCDSSSNHSTEMFENKTLQYNHAGDDFNDGCDNKSPKKAKKKKKKKEKSKKRKHNYHDSDQSDLENMELSWVERTKETLEMENKQAQTASSSTTTIESDIPSKKIKLETSNNSTSSKSNDILDTLLKSASNGYNEVKSWNGGVSNLHKTSIQERRKSYDYDDEYNEELDRGKVFKTRNKIDPFSLLKSTNTNPFQVMQQAKYSNNNKNGKQQNNSHHQSSNSGNNVEGYKRIKFKFSSSNHNSSSNNRSNNMNGGREYNNYKHYNNNKYYNNNGSNGKSNHFHHNNRNNATGNSAFYAKNNFKCR